MAPKENRLQSLEPVNVTLFGKRVFTDVVKELEMGTPPRWTINAITSLPIRESQREI